MKMKVPGKLKTPVKYALLQIPGFLIFLIVLLVFHRYMELSKEWIGVLLLLWIGKDTVLYPFVKSGYESAKHDSGAALRGVQGHVVRRLAPDGLIRIGPELWRARLSDDQMVLEEGAGVRVLELDGLLLIVEAVFPDTAKATKDPVDRLSDNA